MKETKSSYQIEEKQERLNQLWDEYLKTRKKSIRDKLIVEYSPLVKYIVLRLASDLPSSVEIEDLISVGIMGLIKAIENYDPKFNTKFETYATIKIKGAVLDELRRLDWVSRGTRQKIKMLNQAYQELSSKLGRAPYDEEVAEYLGISKEEFDDLTSNIAPVVFSLEDVLYSGKDDNDVRFEDMIKDESTDNPLKNIEIQQLKEILKEAINELPEKERIVIALYHFEELSLKEIGKVLNISEGRVSQLHTKAIMKLKAKVKTKFLEKGQREK